MRFASSSLVNLIGLSILLTSPIGCGNRQNQHQLGGQKQIQDAVPHSMENAEPEPQETHTPGEPNSADLSPAGKRRQQNPIDESKSKNNPKIGSTDDKDQLSDILKNNEPSYPASLHSSQSINRRGGSDGGGGEPLHASKAQIIDAFQPRAPADRIQNWAANNFEILVGKVRSGLIPDTRLRNLFASMNILCPVDASTALRKAKLNIKSNGPCLDDHNQPVSGYAKFNDVGGEICLSAERLSEIVPKESISLRKELMGHLIHEVTHQLGIKKESDAEYIQSFIVEADNNLRLRAAHGDLSFVKNRLQEYLSARDQSKLDAGSSCKLLAKISTAAAGATSSFHSSINLEGTEIGYSLFDLSEPMTKVLDKCDQFMDLEAARSLQDLYSRVLALHELTDVFGFPSRCNFSFSTSQVTI